LLNLELEESSPHGSILHQCIFKSHIAFLHYHHVHVNVWAWIGRIRAPKIRKTNLLVGVFLIFLHNFCTTLNYFFFFFFFWWSTIGFIFLHVSHKYSMVDLWKKLLELCKSCARNITLYIMHVWAFLVN